MLDHAQEYYKAHGKKGYSTPAQYKEEYPFLKEVDSLALCNVQMNLQTAYNNFFQQMRKSKKANIHYKSKKYCKNSYTTNNQGQIIIEDNYIRLPKIGKVKFIYHRELGKNEKIKSITVSMNATGKYYISILVEYTEVIEQVKLQKVLGLDYKMNGFYCDSEGKTTNYPRYYRKLEAKLKLLSKKFSNKVKGSKNHEKARLKLVSHHEKIANLRNNFLHQLSHHLAKNYDVIVVEDINLQEMSKALKFGKSVYDNSFGRFREYLAYKLAKLGKVFYKAPKHYASTQICSNCGNRKTKDEKLKLDDTVYNCKKCGINIDRDKNAAINLQTLGTREFVFS